MIKNNNGVIDTRDILVIGLILMNGIYWYSKVNNGTPLHPGNKNLKYANPQNLEFKVKDLDSNRQEETILFDKEKKENYLLLRDEKGNLQLKEYDLKIEYKNSGEIK
ncbi:MAG: hypothetical protein V1886_01905 [archaeon]